MSVLDVCHYLLVKGLSSVCRNSFNLDLLVYRRKLFYIYCCQFCHIYYHIMLNHHTKSSLWYEVKVVCHQPVFFVSKPHPSLEHGRVGLENVDQNENEGYICAFCHTEKKICQRPLLSPKKAIYLFFNPKSSLLIQI